MSSRPSSACVASCFGRVEWSDVFAESADLPGETYLVRQGSIPSTVYILDEGVIKIVHVTSEGDDRVIDIRRASALVGAEFVVAERASSVDVITVTRCSLRARSETS